MRITYPVSFAAPPLLQGLLSGTVFACGYGLGVLIIWAWRLLELPEWDLSVKVKGAFVALGAVGAAATLLRAPVWQNSIRALMEMDLVQPGAPFQIAGIAFVTALVLILLTRFLIFLARRFVGAVFHIMPIRTAAALGIFVFFAGPFSLVDGRPAKEHLRQLMRRNTHCLCCACWRRLSIARRCLERRT